MSAHDFDIIVAGAGHAGVEAALAAARLGRRVLLVTMNLDAIAQMSCNPAIGGIAKGQMVREIDALGGIMAQAIDATGIQFRMLGTSKGPAVRSPRAQADKQAYHGWVKRTVESQPGLSLRQDQVDDIIVDGGRAAGVRLRAGYDLRAQAVIITAGTFLGGTIHQGLVKREGGRFAELGARELTPNLQAAGIVAGRMKTGTPPRLNGRTIRYEGLEAQHGDEPPRPFGHRTSHLDVQQIPCWVTRTTPATHAVIRANLDRSPLYSGRIKGVGPRYCPSIEDKVVRFPERDGHPVQLEPEGRHTLEFYVNGVSTSLPPDVQDAYIRTIPGLEEAEIIRYGYAVEYDYFPPTQLLATLESKKLPGLYFAGQVNGTSGYEEAAGQGLMAGINAALAIQGRPPLILRRDQAYIGVLIDDLVTLGPVEPYRMFTSRAEHRLLLRTDNADTRLLVIGQGLGLVDETFRAARAAVEDQVQGLLRALGELRLEGRTLAEWLRRPEVGIGELRGRSPGLAALSATDEALERAEIRVKYEGYIRRQEAQVERLAQKEAQPIAADFDYAAVPSFSKEGREKLSAVRPLTLGQAGRIAGVTPADVGVLAVAIERQRRRKSMDRTACPG